MSAQLVIDLGSKEESTKSVDGVITHLRIFGQRREIHAIDFWETLLKGVAFDVANLKVDVVGLNLKSIESLLTYIKKLAG